MTLARVAVILAIAAQHSECLGQPVTAEAAARPSSDLLFVVRPSTELKHMQQVRDWLVAVAHPLDKEVRLALMTTGPTGPDVVLDFTNDRGRFVEAARGLSGASGLPLNADSMRFALSRFGWKAGSEQRVVVLGAPGETGLSPLVYRVAAERGVHVWFIQYAADNWAPGPWSPPTRMPSVLSSNGTQSSIHVRRAVVITNQRDLDMLWAEHNGARPGALPKPVVDFETQSLVAVFAGDKPTHGYALYVKAIKETDRSIEVHVGLISPDKDVKVIRQITQPWLVIPVDKKGNKPVRVFYSEK